MSRTFVKNLLWLQALNWLIKPVWILWIERTVQVQLGNEWYGRYFVHFNLGLLFAVLLDAGLNAYVSREVASKGRLVHRNRVPGLRLFFGGIYVALVGIVAYQQQLDWRILAFVLLNQILASVLLLMRAVIQGRQLFISDGFLSVADRLIAIVLSAWFLFGSNTFIGLNGIVVFLMAQTAGYAVAVLLGWYLLRFEGSRRTPQTEEITEVPSFGRWTREVIWFVAMALFMSVFTRIDALMIRNLSPDLMGLVGLDSGYFQAGIYAQSYRLLDAGLIFSTLLSTQLLPIFSKNIKEGKDNTVFMWLSFRLVWMVGLVALFTAYIFGDDILELLYGAKWEGGPETALAVRSHHIFIYLMGAFVAMSSIHVFGTFITAEGRMKWLTFLALAAMGLNMGINFWLIPIYGAMGAAVSALITQWFFAGACAVRVWQSETIKTQNLKWKVIPISAFHGLVLALGVYRVNGLPQREILEAVVWLLFVIGVVWMLFGVDIADFWKNRKTQIDKVL